MPQNPAGRIHQRHTAVTFDTDILDQLDVGIEFMELAWMVDAEIFQHRFAGAAGWNIEGRQRLTFPPPGLRTEPGAVLSKVRNVGIVHLESSRHVLHQRRKKIDAHLSSCAFRDYPQRFFPLPKGCLDDLAV